MSLSHPARRHLPRQDPEGREARWPARRASHEVRADRQCEDRESARHHDPALDPESRGPDHPV